ncbi:hypothetical protein [Bifidobacterium tissieri]|uniref:Membrane protein 6-pyruvoyl-tetrahydropterin synthase-related domain-containing protein n=1 Tax=Bifidobacterium tissieri TaxID=1630162 RepID=A0A5M9ZJ11_9BIFI|nr:hypothetical protein [Bifidobacterium tissieri]KAA8827333.1 hypothetical protein EMO89_10935 [Bifidobacterium tissieri]KAA8830640.1 hypothetical protein EM849_09225 [Bifidobacterium tissieri]
MTDGMQTSIELRVGDVNMVSFERRKNMAVAVALLGIFVLSSIPMFMTYLPFTPGHDLFFHLYRIQGIADALRDGQFPIRMQTSQLNGYGYPVSILYGDIFLYPAAVLHLMGVSVNTSYKLFVLSINLLTVLTTYVIARRIFGSRVIGILAGALWTLAPYRLEDVYLRASVGEYTALLFVPILLYGMYEIFFGEKGRFSWLWVAIGCSGIILSHAVSVFLVAVPASILLVAGLIRHHSLMVWKNLLLSGVTAIGLSLWFLIPFIDYYRNVDMKVSALDAAGKMVSAAANAVQPAQMFMLFMPMEGMSSGDANSVHEMPFALGWSLLAGLVLFTVAALLSDSSRPAIRRVILIGAMVGIVALVTMFMATTLFHWSVTRFAWWNKAVSTLATIQFPWRFLGVISVLLVFLVCAGVFLIQSEGLLRRAAVPVVTVLLVLSACESGVAMTTWMTNAESSGPFSVAEKNAASNYGVMNGEYLPASTDTGRLFAGESQLAKTHGATITNYEKRGTTVAFDIEQSSDGSRVELPLLMYPHYVVESDANDGQLELTLGDNGRMSLLINESFSGHVTVRFVEPLSWRIAEAVSCITIVTLVVVWAVARVRGEQTTDTAIRRTSPPKHRTRKKIE